MQGTLGMCVCVCAREMHYLPIVLLFKFVYLFCFKMILEYACIEILLDLFIALLLYLLIIFITFVYCCTCSKTNIRAVQLLLRCYIKSNHYYHHHLSPLCY